MPDALTGAGAARAAGFCFSTFGAAGFTGGGGATDSLATRSIGMNFFGAGPANGIAGAALGAGLGTGTGGVFGVIGADGFGSALGTGITGAAFGAGTAGLGSTFSVGLSSNFGRGGGSTFASGFGSALLSILNSVFGTAFA